MVSMCTKAPIHDDAPLVRLISHSFLLTYSCGRIDEPQRALNCVDEWSYG